MKNPDQDIKIADQNNKTDEFKFKEENELVTRKRALRKELNQRQCSLSDEYKKEASLEIARGYLNLRSTKRQKRFSSTVEHPMKWILQLLLEMH